jgi:hypothetical protein
MKTDMMPWCASEGLLEAVIGFIVCTHGLSLKTSAISAEAIGSSEFIIVNTVPKPTIGKLGS